MSSRRARRAPRVPSRRSRTRSSRSSKGRPPREEDRTMSDTRAGMRAWWQQLAAIMLKEAKQVTRDPSSWIIAVVLPLTFLFLFGYGISLDTTVIRVAVVREDDGRDARALAAAFTARSGSRWSPLTIV